MPFDPALAWKNGDTIPRRYLRQTDGSRGDVVQPKAARWRNGFWDVTLVRDMDTGNPLDDKIFKDGGNYDLAFQTFLGLYVLAAIAIGFVSNNMPAKSSH